MLSVAAVMDTNSTRQPAHSSTLVRGLGADPADNNPWWRGDRQFGLPPMRRWAFAPVLTGVLSGLTPVTVLRGPRDRLENNPADAGRSKNCWRRGSPETAFFGFNSTTCRS